MRALSNIIRCKCFKTLPLVAYRCCKNIGDILVRAQLTNSTDTSNSRPTPGSFRCNNRNCTTCPYIEHGRNQYTFHSTGETHHIKSHITCETFNVIYLIQCRLCNLQYIGETKRRLKDRFNEHRRPIFNPIGNYIHTAVPEPVIIPTIICFWFLLKNSEMRVILSGKHLKPTLSIKLRQLSLWASINVMNCNYIVFLSSHTIPRHI